MDLADFRNVASIYPPDVIEAVTLKSRQPVPDNAPNTFTDVAVPRARRKPTSYEDAVMAGVEAGEITLTFALFDPSTAPKRSDRITDSSGVTYEIKSIVGKLARTVYNCVVVQDV